MTDRRVAAALAGSAAATIDAPTHLTTRPWRWVVHTDHLDLYADRRPWKAKTGRKAKTDREGKLLLIDCGGVLYLARAALAADGLTARVAILPNPDADPDHVARLTAEPMAKPTAQPRAEPTAQPRAEPTPQPGAEPTPQPGAVGASPYPNAEAGHGPIPARAIGALVRAAADQGVRLAVLAPDQVAQLAAATAVPRQVRERLGHDTSTVYAVLCGEDDTEQAWLRAGAALAAVSMAATQQHMSVTSSLAAVEPPGSRRVVRRQLGKPTTPYLALRVDLGQNRVN